MSCIVKLLVMAMRRIFMLLRNRPTNNAPVNTVAPVQTETSRFNFSVTSGAWSGEPTSYSYLWYQGDTPDPALSQGNTANLENIGVSIKCRITATNEFGSTSVFSNAIVIA